MKDVADLVGVSKTTVSHVLNNTRHVAPETRCQVLEAVRKLNYYKNVHAHRLARGESDFFGLLISDIENPFFPELIKSFETAVVEKGFDVLLCATNYDPGRTQVAVRKMIENKVRGVAVMTSQAGDEIARELAAHQVPVVFLDLTAVKAYMSNIRLDYSTGIRQAVDHLYQLGHREFAFVAGPETRRSAAKYRQAVVEAINQRGLACLVLEGNQKIDGGAAAARALLSQPALPTAVLCGNDLTAIGVMTALEEAALRVPEQVSVVGSDDIYFAPLARPSLTTVRLDRNLLGKVAFQALETILRSKRRRGAEYVVGTQLVVRQSTGPVWNRDLRLDVSTSPSAVSATP